MHQVQDLIALFNQCFAKEYNTQLIKGGEEPVYLPADSIRSYHAIYFAHGYFRSALHECAHWLVAGAARRELEDFGYWYYPDGRNAKQQHLFQAVEVKPQALEWILTKACQHPFRVSLDNLNGEVADEVPFKHAVYQQVISYCQKGLPKRAQRFRAALSQFYNSKLELVVDDFNLDELF